MSRQSGGDDVAKSEAPLRNALGLLGDVGKVIALLWFMCALGLASLAFPAYGSSNPWRVLAVGFFLAGGSTLAGSAIGFLFGVPRHTARAGAASSYVPNTNLERISDWLTKILIGAGLSQASNLTTSLTTLARYAGPVFGEAPAGPVIAGALIVHQHVRSSRRHDRKAQRPCAFALEAPCGVPSPCERPKV